MNADELDQIAQQERPRLIGLAYRMTGSHSDAEQSWAFGLSDLVEPLPGHGRPLRPPWCVRRWAA